jgi:hypothetical protein
VYRVKCPDCGVKVEKVPLLPRKAPFSKRFEDAVGQACESAAARQVARRFGLSESAVRAIDLRYLERWAAKRCEPPLRQMGVDGYVPAYRDFATGVLAILALLTARIRPLFRSFVVAFNLVGAADIIFDYYHATQVDLPGMAGQLGTTYAIPIIYVPLLMITHRVAFYGLLRHPQVST